MRRPGPALFVLLVALTLGAAACADDGESADVATTTSAPPSTTTTAAAATTTATAPTPPSYGVEVATLNVLHGFPAASDCGVDTDQCNAPVRARLIWQMLEDDAGCPEIVALQEIDARWFEIVPEILPDLCGGGYVLLTEEVGSPDQEMILTTLPVLDHARMTLAGGPIWSAHWAQLDAGDGVTVDVFATHYASSSLNLPCMDNPFDPCSPTCPDDMAMGDCHPFQTLEFLAERAAPRSLQLVIGDLNKELHEPRIQTLIADGFVDTHLLAGNPECSDDGGPTCTTGIGNGTDTDYAGLDVRENVPRRRIDFILAKAPDGCTVVVDGQDTDEADTDGDGTRTGVWASTPLAEPVEGLYWAADHAGIQADIGLDCA